MTRVERGIGTIVTAFLLIALGGSWLLGVPAAADAQDLAAEFPPGVELSNMVDVSTDGLPETPAVFRLERNRIGRGWDSGGTTASGPLLFYIESGNLTVVDELGIEGVYPAGTQLVVPKGALFSIRNDGKEPVSLLLLSLLPTADNGTPSPLDGTPAASRGRGTPGPSASPRAGQVVSEPIVEADVTTMPPAPVHLFLVRLTWAPGSVLGEHVFSGPTGFVGVDGALTVAGPSGIEGQLRAGKAVMFPAGLPNHARNAGKDPAVVLMAGMTGGNQPLILSADGTAPNATPGAPAISTSTAGSAATPVAVQPGSVPMFRGNAARTGEMPGPGPDGAPVLRWSVDFDGLLFSTAAVVDGTLYVGTTESHSLVALDAATGKQRWAFKTGNWVSSSPAVADGIVYFGSSDANIYAVDAASGKQVWKAATKDEVISSPVVVDGVVYVASTDNTLFALDAASGAVRWKFDLQSTSLVSPAVDGGMVYIGSDSGLVHALDAKSGDERWRFTANGGVTASPAVAGGHVFVATAKGTVHAIDAATGAELWRFDAGDTALRASPAAVDGIVYVADEDGVVHALDVAAGEERWRFETAGAVLSSPAMSGGTLYISSNDGNLYALNTADGSERWRFEIGRTNTSNVFEPSPVVVSSFVYVSSVAGTLFAIGGNAGANAVTPTPVPISQGATVEVVGEGAVLRAAPSNSGVVIANLELGARLKVVGPSERRDGKVWWKVEGANGEGTGYISEDDVKLV